jgi:hypothetical protein
MDLEHLQLLGIFHYIVGGLTILFSSFFIIHVVLGLVLAFNPDAFPAPKNDPDFQFPPFMGIAMAVFAGMFVLGGWTIGILTIYSGRCLRQQRKRLLSMIVAGFQCAFVPVGTLLGVFTIIVLQRDSVRRLYGE